MSVQSAEVAVVGSERRMREALIPSQIAAVAQQAFRLSTELSTSLNQDDFAPLDAREALIIKFRGKARKLALSILKKWRARLDINELTSIVDLSLCEAARLYNPAKGASFITFLFYHLRGNLIRGVAAAVAASAIPGINPDSEALHLAMEDGEFVGTAQDVAEALNSSEVPQPDEVLYRKEVIEQTRRACSELGTVEREIVERMFLAEEQVMDIAESIGYSRCHVSRMKKKALGRLHRDLSKRLSEEALALSRSLKKCATPGKSASRNGSTRRVLKVRRTKAA